MARSFNRRLARLLRVDDTVRNTVTSAFDSDQIVTIIGENAAGGGSGGLGDYGVVNSTGTAASATGTDSIAIGQSSLATANTSITIGVNAAAVGTNGIALGMDADAGNASGSIENIAIGRLAQAGMTNGDAAIAIGRSASAPYNRAIAIGNSATASTEAIAMGNQSNAINYNVAIGYYAKAQSGNQTVSIGRDSKALGWSVSIGAYSGQSLTSGQYNVTVGAQAGSNYNTNEYTVAIGYNAMGGSTTYSMDGDYNTAVGANAMQYSSGTGLGNTAMGYSAGQSITNAINNTFIGSSAGYTSTSGGYNTIVGANCRTNSATGASSVVIGYNLIGKGNNTGYMGASSSNFNPANTSSWNTTSDIRVKKNIADYTNGLDKLELINVKTYNYRSDSDIAKTYPELADSDGNVHENLPQGKTIVGLIAQELETVLPNSVTTRDNGFKSMDKDELFWVMLNSIKELKARVEALENN